MARSRYIAGLYIGSGNIRAALIDEKSDGGINIIGVSEAESAGVRKGVVFEPEEASESIRRALGILKKKTGINIKHVYVGIGGYRTNTHIIKTSVAVSRADGYITDDDIKRVMASAEDSLPKMQNRQILNKFPNLFSVDGEMTFTRPVGMTGRKLEAEVIFITTLLPHYNGLIEALTYAGVIPDEIFISIIAASDLVLTKKQKEVGVIMLNLGSQTSEIAVWEEGALLLVDVLPIGSANITNDIALGFRINIDTAERLKRAYSYVTESGKKDNKLSGFGKELESSFDPKKYKEIIHARLGDIFELTEKNLKKIGRNGLLPAGIVISGGGAGLPCISEVARKELMLPVQISSLNSVGGKKDNMNDVEWIEVLGLCRAGLRSENEGFSGIVKSPFVLKVKRALKHLIP